MPVPEENGSGGISQKQRLQIRGVESVVTALIIGGVLLFGNTLLQDLFSQWRDGPVTARRLHEGERERNQLRQELSDVQGKISELTDSINILTTRVVELSAQLRLKNTLQESCPCILGSTEQEKPRQ